MSHRGGALKTNLSGAAMYKSFMPSPLPPNPPVEFDDEMMELLLKANKQLTLLEGIASRIPNVNLFISMYVQKEALMSSQIEGTQATLEDVLDPLLDDNVNVNVADVINYVKATGFAIDRLKELPLCNRLIKEAHAVLLKGIRGQEKNPGEFRISQNWIGGQGSTIKNAVYIPPSPDDMTNALSDLERYINNNDELDVLIRAALIHYQFETIHPFLDGNGRIGRLLVTLYLFEKGVLTSPTLYISYYLKQNRTEYYDRLSEVRRNGNYEQWIKFFLRAIYESSEDATQTIDKLISLHNVNVAAINKIGRASGTAIRLLAYLEANPIINIQKTSAALGVTFATVADSVRRLCEMGILTQYSGDRRNRTFAYSAYLDLLRNGT